LAASLWRLSMIAEVPKVSMMEKVVARSVNRNCLVPDEGFSFIFISFLLVCLVSFPFFLEVSHMLTHEECDL
jgi:hypothetical protein